METSQPLSSGIVTSSSASHPMMIAAAASVTVLSLAGVAFLAGWLPGPATHGADSPKPPTVQAQPAAPAPAQPTVAVPREQLRPAAKVATARPHPGNRSTPQEPSPLPSQSPTSRVDNGPYIVAGATTPVAGPVPPICRECGIVESVQEVAVEAKGSGGGAVAGGIVGGIIGNQIGRGATRDIATVLGAVGGAFAGNHIEKSTKESKRYDVRVRFEDGSTKTISAETPPPWHSGDYVKLQNGTLISGAGKSTSALGTI